MNIKPLGDRIVIQMLESQETTKSGIILLVIHDRFIVQKKYKNELKKIKKYLYN